MTETPKCPYCGAELEVTHAFVSNAVAAHQMVYTCFCRECGIYTPKRSTPEEALSAATIKSQPAEADRALKAYGLYCQLCEMLTGKAIAKLDELLTAAKKARRELVISDGAYKHCEAENTKLKEMAAEDILRAALRGYPCDSCVNNTLDVRCECDNCADCEHHCTCYECHDNESFVWRGGK